MLRSEACPDELMINLGAPLPLATGGLWPNSDDGEIFQWYFFTGEGCIGFLTKLVL